MGDLETLSREIDLLAKKATALKEDWIREFGDDAFANPVFIESYLRLLRGHSVLGVLKGVYLRETGEQAPPFEERFVRTAEAFAEGQPAFDAVPLSILHYLDRLVAEARQQRAEGLLADPEALKKLVVFGRQLKDLPALSGFRKDHLERFPSKDVVPESETPPASRQKPKELPKGYRLGKVEVVRLLGAGGFAQVYLVHHPGLGEYRAAKLFTKLNLLGELDQLLKAFYAEAQLQNKLKHPNIVRVLDVDEHEGYLVLIMEYVEGKTLRALIDERRKEKSHLSPKEILEIAIQAARGIEYAHAHQIMHRDLKPENIMIAEGGAVKIMDYGLAKTLNDSGQRRTTRLGNLIGTPHYMAPEQVFGDVYDLRVDLYALGAVLYTMAYGQPPFDGKDAWKILEKTRDEKPVPLSDHLENFPAELDRIVLRLLEKKPENRYSTATELIQDLEACKAALPATLLRLPAARSRRRRIVVGALALLAVATLWSLFFGWGRISPTAMPAREDRADRLHSASDPLESRPSPPSSLESKGKPKTPEPADSAPQPIRQGPIAAVPEPKSPNPPSRPVAVPLRQQLAQYPMSPEDVQFVSRVLELFWKHRPELLSRHYEPLAKELEGLKADKDDAFRGGQLEVAKELTLLADELVQDRWHELSGSKDQIRLPLENGQILQGIVDRSEGRTITIADDRGGKTAVDLAQVTSDAFLHGKTVAQAEAAYQALSGDAGKALTEAQGLEKKKEKIALWYPLLVRMARLSATEHIRATIVEAEDPLARRNPRPSFEKTLSRYPRALATLKALSDAETDICSLFPFLEGDFKAARREGEALELLLNGAYSKTLVIAPGTESEKLAATMLLADFLATLEPAHNDLMAKLGWLNYNWELRPDEQTVQDRLQFWDLLDEGGCVLRDPKGPRSLIMGRPHPRCSEGMLIRFDFEPLGEDGATAEWRFNLRREGGGQSYLRFDRDSFSLRTSTLGAAAPDETLVTAKIPAAAEPRSHTCVLIPGEQLHVLLDGALLVNLKKEDALLPAQPSFVVQRGKLSIRSLQVLKKPTK